MKPRILGFTLGVLVVALPGVVLVTGGHLEARSRTQSPHGTLDMDCAECHSPEGWTPILKTPAFRHDRTGFALEGSHGPVACRSCHQSLVFNQVGIACLDCHRDAHRGELGTQCEACHTPRTWSNQREMFQFHNRTRFPLFAVHAKVDCQSCHRGQRPFEYANTPTDCGTCHARTFEETTNPNHVAAGFSRRCEDCHALTTTDWRASSFNHATFPLQGAHTRLVCAQCHAGGFRGTSRECVGCHRADYDGTTNPNHASSGFPRTCEDCHSTSAWRPANLDHDGSFFPINSGEHRGAWSSCGDCHTNPGNFRVFECIRCHEHSNKREVDDDHHRISGYSYTSAACYRCHPQGRED